MARRLRLLWVTPFLPRHGVSATREYLCALLQRLAPRHEITVLAFVDPEEAEAPAAVPPELAGLERVTKIPHVPDDPLLLTPRAVRWGFSHPSLRQAVAEQLAAGRYDLVQYEYTEMGQVMPPPVVPTILKVHQLWFAAAAPMWRAQGGGLFRGGVALHQYLRDLDFELRAVARAHHVVTVSQEDARRLRRFHPQLPVSVLPVGVDLIHFRPPGDPAPPDVDVLFVGHFRHLPNADAARFLVRDVLPRLGRPACVRLVGSAVTPEVAALARPGGVDVAGTVPDVRPHLARARVVVAPVRFGTGMRGKVLEALAMGRPVVSTTLGAEGLGATSGDHLLVADDAAGFARAVSRLLEDPDLAARLGARGRALVEERFGWDALADAHEAIFERVMDRPRTPAIQHEATPALLPLAAHLGRAPAIGAGAAWLALRGLGWHARRLRAARAGAGDSPLESPHVFC